MDLSRNVEDQARRARRWKVGFLAAFYLVAFSATIPFINTGPIPNRAKLHEDKAAQCRHFEKLARSGGRSEEAEALARSARNHDRLAEAHHAEAARTRLTWLAFLIKRWFLDP